jgi:hypothetical protein
MKMNNRLLPSLGVLVLFFQTLESAAPCRAAEPATFAIETYGGRCLNYLNHMVDAEGQPYFNIFWTQPAEAAHDWPDLGDVIGRQLQGAIMVRHMTGQEVATEKVWHRKVLSLLSDQDGLHYRPRTSYSSPDRVYWCDQAVTLSSLVTAYVDRPDELLRQKIIKLVDGLSINAQKKGIPGGFEGGFCLPGLMHCARHLHYKPAAMLAGTIVEKVFARDRTFAPDNHFRHGGHMHGNLHMLTGAADYALYAKDPVLFSRIDALYRYVRSEATRFGFLPEVIGRKGDVVSCETCAVMDYVALAVILANHGHPEYWADVERTARNQLVESQVVDASWLKSDPNRPDTPQFTWREIGERMVGGWAGWSSPTHILAAKETLHWGGPELRGKTRAFQNCCGGSGAKALFVVWKNASRFENGTLSVHLHIDKLLPQAEVRCYQPYKGLLTIELKQPCKVRVRIPEFVEPKEIKAKSNQGAVKTRVWGNYLELGDRKAGEKLEVTYPVPLRDEEIAIGNPGFRQYRYRVTWKGDTVVRMTPVGEQVKTGFSDFDGKPVEIFYGKDGPSPLYQREQMLKNVEPQKASLHMDDGSLDFWFLLTFAQRISRGPGTDRRLVGRPENKPNGSAGRIIIQANINQ